MQLLTALLVASTLSLVSAHPNLTRRASLPVPPSKGSVTYSSAQTITNFDGGMKTYGRGKSCSGQKEGGDKDAVFIIKNGGSLSNAIIGPDQAEGVHCEGSCTITNVWWVDVCEDALTIKGNGNALVQGGGAANADDKVIQHNGFGTVTIDGFTVTNFGKLYRSCGNCSKQGKRDVIVRNVKSSDGKTLVGINSNFGDTATISNTCATSVKSICDEFEGTSPGNEPKKISSGPSASCKFTNPLPKC